jgi:hypothetical protein
LSFLVCVVISRQAAVIDAGNAGGQAQCGSRVFRASHEGTHFLAIPAGYREQGINDRNGGKVAEMLSRRASYRHHASASIQQ